MTTEVSIRLADGAAAVANTVSRVAARCAGVSPQTVRDCYTAEDGMGLAELDADGSALSGAAAAGDEALSAARAALAALREAWQGPSATAAAEVLESQCVAAAELVAGLRDASAALLSLREHLSELVDAKVEAAVRIDRERAAGPGADSDPGTEWVAAMRSASGAVTAAYDDAINRLSRRLGEGSPEPAAPAAAPVGFPSLPSLGLPADFGGLLPAVLPTILAGVAGIADAVSGPADAVGSGAVGSGAVESGAVESGAGESGEPERAVPAELPQPATDPEAEPARETEGDSEAEPEPAAESEAAPEAAYEQAEAPDPAPLAEPAAEPLAVPEVPAAVEERTPCEIAADELPQVGD